MKKIVSRCCCSSCLVLLLASANVLSSADAATDEMLDAVPVKTDPKPSLSGKQFKAIKAESVIGTATRQFELGKVEEALESLNKALDSNPDDITKLSLLSRKMRFLAYRDSFDEIRKELESLQEVLNSGKLSDAVRTNFFLEAARIDMALGDLKATEQLLSKCGIEKIPGNRDVHFKYCQTRAQFEYARGELRLACQFYQKAIDESTSETDPFDLVELYAAAIEAFNWLGDFKTSADYRTKALALMGTAFGADGGDRCLHYWLIGICTENDDDDSSKIPDVFTTGKDFVDKHFGSQTALAANFAISNAFKLSSDTEKKEAAVLFTHGFDIYRKSDVLRSRPDFLGNLMLFALNNSADVPTVMDEANALIERTQTKTSFRIPILLFSNYSNVTATGDLDKLTEFLSRVRDLAKTNLGEKHFISISCSIPILQVYKAKGMARELSLLAQEVQENCSDLPALIYAANAHLLSRFVVAAEPLKSIQFSKTAMERLTKAGMAKSDSYARALADYANACLNARRNFEATEAAQDSLDLYEKLHPERNEDSLSAALCLARGLKAFERTDEAITLCKKMLLSADRLDDKGLTLPFLELLGELYLTRQFEGRNLDKLAHFINAREYYKRALYMRVQKGVDSPELYKDALQLAVIASELGFQEECKSLVSTLDQFQPNFTTPETMDEILDLYEVEEKSMRAPIISLKDRRTALSADSPLFTLKQLKRAELLLDSMNAVNSLEEGQKISSEILQLIDKNDPENLIRSRMYKKLATWETNPAGAEKVLLKIGKIREVSTDSDEQFESLRLPNSFYLKKLETLIENKVIFFDKNKTTAEANDLNKANRLLLTAIKIMAAKELTPCVDLLRQANALFQKNLGKDSYECSQCNALIQLRMWALRDREYAESDEILPFWTRTVRSLDDNNYKGDKADLEAARKFVARCASKESALEELAYMTCLINQGYYRSVEPYHFYRACDEAARSDSDWFLDISRKLLSSNDLVWCSDALRAIEKQTGLTDHQRKLQRLLVAAWNLEIGESTQAFDLSRTLLNSLVDTDTDLRIATQEILLRASLKSARHKDALEIANQITEHFKTNPPSTAHEFESSVTAANVLAMNAEIEQSLETVRKLVSSSEGQPSLLNPEQRANLFLAYSRLLTSQGSYEKAKRWLDVGTNLRLNMNYSNLDDLMLKVELAGRAKEDVYAGTLYEESDKKFSHLSSVLAISELSTYAQNMNRLMDMAITFRANILGLPLEIFKWKGKLLDCIRRKTKLIQHSRSAPLKQVDPEALKTALDAYNDVRAKLSRALTNPGSNPADLEALSREKERCEHNLQDYVEYEGAAEETKIETLSDIMKFIPSDESLVDIHKYFDLNENEYRYGAFILSSSEKGEDFYVDLGTSEDVDRKILKWLEVASLGNYEGARSAHALRTAKEARNDGSKELKELTDSIVTPIVKKLPTDVKRLWVCPDSKTFLMPWDLAGRTLDSELACATIDSVNDLIALRKQQDEGNARLEPFLGISYSFSNSDAPLRHTASEVQQIADEAKNTREVLSPVVDKIQESGQLLTAASKAGYLHIATHGFFLEPEIDKSEQPETKEEFKNKEGVKSSGEIKSLVANKTDDESKKAEDKTRALRLSLGTVFDKTSFAANPLLRSGLLLYTEGDDKKAKIEALTAEEILGSDLSKCEVVSLSACETGLGEIIDGQGILGLRSAFRGAGAHSVLMSLWPVNDQATNVLMRTFYKELWSGKSKGESLRIAQDAVKNSTEQNWSHPFYWAGWVLSGESW